MQGELFERDWRFMFDAVYRINSVECIDTFRREALECLKVLIPSTKGVFFLASTEDDGDMTFSEPLVFGDETESMSDYLAGAYDHDQYYRGMGLSLVTESYRDSDLMPATYRERTGLVKKAYSEMGVYYALRTYLVHKRKLVGNIELFRSKEEGDFSDRDLQVFETFAPHIALALGRLREQAQNASPARSRQEEIMESCNLTPREREVVHLVAEGIEDSEAADMLCISVSTLKKHVYNAYRKLDVNNRVQLCLLLSSDDNR